MRRKEWLSKSSRKRNLLECPRWLIKFQKPSLSQLFLIELTPLKETNVPLSFSLSLCLSLFHFSLFCFFFIFRSIYVLASLYLSFSRLLSLSFIVSLPFSLYLHISHFLFFVSFDFTLTGHNFSPYINLYFSFSLVSIYRLFLSCYWFSSFKFSALFIHLLLCISWLSHTSDIIWSCYHNK